MADPDSSKLVSSSPFLKADKALKKRVVDHHPLSKTPSQPASNIASKPLAGKGHSGLDPQRTHCLSASQPRTHDVVASLKKNGFAMVTLPPSLAESVEACLRKAETFFSNCTARIQLANLNKAFRFHTGGNGAFTDEYLQEATREILTFQEGGFVARQALLNDVAATLVTMDERYVHNWALLRPEQSFEASSLAELASSILLHVISSETESPPVDVDAVVEQLATGERPGATTGNRLSLCRSCESGAAASSGVSPQEGCLFSKLVSSQSDCGFLTLLSPQDGLEVWHQETQSWERVEAVENCVVVIPGRLLQWITQDGIRASSYRVRPSTPSQVSMAYTAKPPPGTRMQLRLRMRGSVADCSITVFVRSMTGKTVLVASSSTDTIAALKRKVAEKEASFPAEEQCLQFQRRQLRDERTLSDYGIKDNDQLGLMLVPPGTNTRTHIFEQMMGAASDVDGRGLWFDGDAIMGTAQPPKCMDEKEAELRAELEALLERWTALMMLLHPRLGALSALSAVEETVWKAVCHRTFGLNFRVRVRDQILEPVSEAHAVQQPELLASDAVIHSISRSVSLLQLLKSHPHMVGDKPNTAEFVLDGQPLRPHCSLAACGVYDGAVLVVTRKPPPS